MTSWADHAIWWHVYPLGFTGAEKAEPPPGEPVRHRLRQLEEWLDYAVELGCSGLLLGPIFAAETHGYDTIDHFHIDPRLGDQEDFDRLVAVAGQHGLRILLDGVFNHVGRSFPAFQAALAGGPGSPAARWFRRDPAGGYATFEGHPQLVTLDHEEPEVLDYVAQVMTHWLDRGAAGWRLDAAYAVPPSFWSKALPRVREVHPDAWFLGEMIHGDYAAYAADSGLDSVTQYELWKAIWSSLNDLRRRHPWLVHARTTAEHLTNEAIAYRAADDSAQILVLLNTSDSPFTFPVDTAGLTMTETSDQDSDNDDPALVSPHGWAILTS